MKTNKMLVMLNDIVLNKAALVPVQFSRSIMLAARHLGITLFVGALSADSKEIVLYINE